MLFGFATANANNASAAQLIYAVYRSRDRDRGPTGIDMWGQITRYARASAKRADNVGDFLREFCRRMGCSSIQPRYMKLEGMPRAGTVIQTADGEVLRFDDNERRDFMLEIVEGTPDVQKAVVDAIYERTQNILLLVRDRLEREKPIDDISAFTDTDTDTED